MRLAQIFGMYVSVCSAMFLQASMRMDQLSSPPGPASRSMMRLYWQLMLDPAQVAKYNWVVCEKKSKEIQEIDPGIMVPNGAGKYNWIIQHENFFKLRRILERNLIAEQDQNSLDCLLECKECSLSRTLPRRIKEAYR